MISRRLRDARERLALTLTLAPWLGHTPPSTGALVRCADDMAPVPFTITEAGCRALASARGDA